MFVSPIILAGALKWFVLLYYNLAVASGLQGFVHFYCVFVINSHDALYHYDRSHVVLDHISKINSTISVPFYSQICITYTNRLFKTNRTMNNESVNEMVRNKLSNKMLQYEL